MKIGILLFTVAALSAPLEDFLRDVGSDFRSYYSKERLIELAGFSAASAITANTGLDVLMRRTWQKHIKSAGTQEVSRMMCLIREEGIFFIPAYMALSALHRTDDQTSLTTWGDLTLRSLIVSYPEFMALSWGIGSSRPFEGHPHWQPFAREHGVSGHAYFGGLPMLAAARVSQSWLLKGAWYAASTLPGLARVDKDKHYFAQVLLGWGLAYMATHHTMPKNLKFYSDGPFIGAQYLL